ncbi:MAG: aspartate-semialdehyde dehydrogenase [Christensenellales bacterium]|jgi:aspartate-semialdehyde dehydrogenase
MKNKLRVGIIGATGMVGQRFILLLAEHPWYEISALAASRRSAGKTYGDSVGERWHMSEPMPEKVKGMIIHDAANVEEVSALCDFVFCAIDMPSKEDIKKLEYAYAQAETPVVSNNSALRDAPDVPMILPEVNPGHADIIPAQRRRLGTQRGFVAVKPNCSIQSYVPALQPLMDFEPVSVTVCTYQAISGAGKTFETMPEIIDNIIPYIGGEEEKSELEPLKIWGKIVGDEIVNASSPAITAQCIRVPVTDGHMAAAFVKFANKPSVEEIKKRWEDYQGEAQKLNLPSAPKQFITYFDEPNMPQTKLHRDLENGMGISVGRLRQDNAGYDYRFISLSHNTLRGAAGGALLMAELLTAKGYITAK